MTYTLFHALQAFLLLIVLAMVVPLTRRILFEARIDGHAFRGHLLALIAAGQVERARQFCKHASPAWAPETCRPLLDAKQAAEVELLADEVLHAAKVRAKAGMRALRILASVASALGFLGAFLAMRWIHAEEHGLYALRAGAVERIALNRAVISIGLGIATSTIGLGAWRIFKRVTKDTYADAKRTVLGLERALTKRFEADHENDAAVGVT